MNQSFLFRYRYPFLAGAISLIYLLNLFIDVMEIDAAQYASISMEMQFNKSFLQVYHRGLDYLDKPPLLFWLSSLSFLLFNISNFAYKFPSVLVLILGIYSTYRFVLLWYNREKAILSAFILATTQAFFLISNDIRTDALLSGFVIFSVWQISEYLKYARWKNLILASIGIGGSMLAKGPIGLVIPVVAFSTDFILKRQWKNFIKPQWLVVLILLALILLPMSYGLYTQFDLHPEKVAYGLKGPSGLKFYYWTQSFGRITGESSWNNGTSFFYFFHTILWDYQPWVLFLIPALGMKLYQLWKNKFWLSEKEEYISGAAFILGFLMLSLSSYKLPHYIFPLFSFAAVFTSDFIINLSNKRKKILSRIQFGIMHLFILMLLIYYLFIFPPVSFYLPIISALIFICIWSLFIKLNTGTDKILIPTLGIILVFNLTLAADFYPKLLHYQSSGEAGKYIRKNHIPNDKVYFYNAHGHALDFYAQQIVNPILLNDIKGLPVGSYIYTDSEGYAQVMSQDTHLKIVKTYDSYKVTRLTATFLNQKTRDGELKKSYLLKKEK